MRNFFKRAKAKIVGAVTFIKTAVCRKIQKARAAAYRLAIRSSTMLAATRGENFVDSGIKILIAVVIGALLLGGLYALFGDTIMPTVTQKVTEMFNFKG